MTARQRAAAPAAAWTLQASSAASNVVDFAQYTGKTHRASPRPMPRILVRGYGAVATAIGLGTLLYGIGFVGGMVVPKSIDSVSGGWPATVALCIDLELLAVVAVVLSGMARRAITARLSPLTGPSSYLLCASLALSGLFAAWQPLPAVLWQVSNPNVAGAIDGVALLGWLTAFYGLARSDRDATCLGLVVAVWAAPCMTAGHLLLAAVVTCHVLLRFGLEQPVAQRRG